jgi:iron complex outermembrane receptor protein
MTLGAKLEHHETIGYAFQPSARVLWTPDERNSVWTSIARAVRTPASVETSIRADYATILGVPPMLTRATGNPDVRAEDLTAYELGYRTRLSEQLALDVATFYNDYHRLQTVETGTPFFEPGPIPHLVLPLVFSNQKGGHSYGFELAADWRPVTWWQLKSAYTFLQIDVTPNPGSTDTNTLFDRTDPKHQFSIRSLMNVGRHVDFDVWLRHVDAIKAFDTAAYTTLDARLAWHPTRDLELSVVGQNLLDQRHFEFGAQPLSVATEVTRSVFFKLKYQPK